MLVMCACDEELVGLQLWKPCWRSTGIWGLHLKRKCQNMLDLKLQHSHQESTGGLLVLLISAAGAS